MHSDSIFNAAAKGALATMNKRILCALAAALAVELAIKCPRVNTLKDFFDEITDAIRERSLHCKVKHDTGLMEQIVYLALV